MDDGAGWRNTVVVPTETWSNPFQGPVTPRRGTEGERARERLHALQTYLETPEPGPSTTPTHPSIYRYSDHIHRDRIFFLARDYLHSNDLQQWQDPPPEEDTAQSPSDQLPNINTLRLQVGETTLTSRRFNEPGSSYIATRKRIKVAQAQALEGLEKAKWSASLPGVRQRTGTSGDNDKEFYVKGRALPPGRSFAGLPPLGNSLSRETSTLHNSTLLTKVEKMGMMPRRATLMPFKLWRQKSDVGALYRYLNKGSATTRNT